tara:strand:- start:51 stop:572 length:522 start_codon:yes stop_codon:yes gene_type:complete
MKTFLLTYENFLEKSLLEQINDYALAALNQANWKSQLFWAPETRRCSDPIHILDLKDKFLKPIQKRFQQVKRKGVDFTIQHLMFNIWAPGSYVEWHGDAAYTFGSTIYLTDTWNPDHGGIFLYQAGKYNIKTILPHYNRCVINSHGLPHTVSALTPDSPLRRTIQIFGTERLS